MGAYKFPWTLKERDAYYASIGEYGWTSSSLVGAEPWVPKEETDMCDSFDVVKLRGHVHALSGYLESLLEEGKFPGKGRSDDAQNANAEWWSERLCAIKDARDFLKTLE